MARKGRKAIKVQWAHPEPRVHKDSRVLKASKVHLVFRAMRGLKGSKACRVLRARRELLELRDPRAQLAHKVHQDLRAPRARKEQPVKAARCLSIRLKRLQHPVIRVQD